MSECQIIKSKKIHDNRGYFTEIWNKTKLENLGIFDIFVQENCSKSLKARTIRGLHFQVPPFAQAKLVRCNKGKIFDVAVDLRRSSSRFGKWFGFELSDHDDDMVYIPEGFAHGFVTLQADTEVTYLCSNFYAPMAEMSLIWNDKTIGIKWPITGDPILSDKDLRAQQFDSFESPFI